jgi:hypothetical protein
MFILKYLDLISPLALLLFIFFTNKVFVRRNYIFWFLIWQTIFNGTAIVLDKLLHKPNLYIYHINCIVSFFVLTQYFSNILTFKKGRFTTLFILIIFIILFIYSLTKWEHLDTFNSTTFGLASFIITTYCLLYYLQNILDPTRGNITESRDFWHVTGLFTYYAGSFFIFLTYSRLAQYGTQNLGVLWLIHNVLLLIMCLYLFKGFTCKSSQEKYKL